MALIYANAVNKRMGHHGLHSERRKRSDACHHCTPCPYASHHKFSTEERIRKKSSTTESGIISDVSSIQLSQSSSPVPGEHHYRVIRSKTSCGDLSKRSERPERSRKISTPVFGSSHSESKQREEMRAQLKHDLDLKKRELSASVQLAPLYHDEEDEESTSTEGIKCVNGASLERRESAFSRMKRKFSNWKM